MEKGVKQGKGSYPLLSMKRDQANKTNVEGVYRQWTLAWEPGPDGSSVDLQLVREWAQHSHMSCPSTHQSWSGAEAEEAEWRWRRWSGGRGSRRQLEVGGEGEGRSYHDITPLLCPYGSEWRGLLLRCGARSVGRWGARGGLW